MIKQLNISDTFKLPAEAVTETFLNLGQRGSGKTNTAAVIAEELFTLGAPFAVLTPIDVWWGLKSSADGKGPGLPIYIFGGAHADLPLTPTAGRLIADVLIDQRISCVICTQGFSGKERAQFVTDFAERLLDKNREPLHLIVEEADAFIPQKPFPGEERMLGAMDRLIRWGRSPSAIGGTFISQRSAKINKDITTQCSVLVAHRTVAPQDVDAIKEWFRYHPDTDKQKQLLSEISSLPKGRVFIYSPAWLEHFGKCQIRLRHTFDSAATPKLGAKAIIPKTAIVDLKALEQKMAETIERVKADNPKELQKEIVALKKQIIALKQATPATVEPVVERSVLADNDRKLILEAVESIEFAMTRAHELGDTMRALISKYQPAPIAATVNRSPRAVAALPIGMRHENHKAPVRKSVTADPHSIVGNSGLRRIMIALAHYPQGKSAREIGVLARLSSKSGTFGNYISKARTSGWIVGDSSLMRLTESGATAIGDYEELPRGQELVEHWLKELGNAGSARIFRELVSVYPKYMSKEDIGKSVDMSHSSGTFGNYLSRLRTLELIESAGRDSIRASQTLFE